MVEVRAPAREPHRHDRWVQGHNDARRNDEVAPVPFLGLMLFLKRFEPEAAGADV
jgi:hypothetical protein